MIASVRLQIQMIMAAIITAARASAQAASEHQEMVETLARGDCEAAESLARRHVEGAQERMLRLLDAKAAD